MTKTDIILKLCVSGPQTIKSILDANPEWTHRKTSGVVQHMRERGLLTAERIGDGTNANRWTITDKGRRQLESGYAETRKRTPNRKIIVEWLDANGSGTVQDINEGTGIKRNSITTVMRDLVSDKKVRREGARGSFSFRLCTTPEQAIAPKRPVSSVPVPAGPTTTPEKALRGVRYGRVGADDLRAEQAIPGFRVKPSRAVAMAASSCGWMV